MNVAALFVESNGCYVGLPDVDAWDVTRDARDYAGPHPVVAHPPCSRWCRLAGLVEARWGHKRGDDAGCFAAALAAVRKWGGVLEHPAYSDAWEGSRLMVRKSHEGPETKRPRVGKAAAARSPIEFRDLLLSIARSAHHFAVAA